MKKMNESRRRILNKCFVCEECCSHNLTGSSLICMKSARLIIHRLQNRILVRSTFGFLLLTVFFHSRIDWQILPEGTWPISFLLPLESPCYAYVNSSPIYTSNRAHDILVTYTSKSNGRTVEIIFRPLVYKRAYVALFQVVASELCGLN